MADFHTETISIQGCRADQAPATLGQRSIWTDIENMMPDTSFYNSFFPVEIGPGVDREQVFAALRTLAARHTSLRSTFFRDAQGTLIQRVCGEGEIAVEFCEARSDHDTDLDALRGELGAKIKGHRFDHEAEWPVRVGIGVVDGAPRVVLLCVSHIAADFPSLQVLVRELDAMLHGGALDEPAMQPVELAEWERSAEGLRVQERALRHWRRELQAMPARLLEEKDTEPESPRYPITWLRSKAVALAADVLGARCRVSSSAVLLVATALLLGRAAQEPRVTMVLISANRTRPALRNYVGNLVQDVPIGIDLTGGDFAAVARSAFSASVQAYRSAHCDRAETERMRQAEAVARGSEVELGYYFNDLRPFAGDAPGSRSASAEEVRAALAESRTGARDGVERDNLFAFLNVLALGEETVEVALRADSLRLSSQEMAGFLLSLEALLLAAVEHGIHTDPRRLLEESSLTAPASGR
jgi:hypothetical protein